MLWGLKGERVFDVIATVLLTVRFVAFYFGLFALWVIVWLIKRLSYPRRRR